MVPKKGGHDSRISSQAFCACKVYFNKLTRFDFSILNFLQHHRLGAGLNSESFFALTLWSLNGIFWRTQFHSIYNGSDSFPGFLNTSVVFLIFSLCDNSNTLFIRTFCSLPHLRKNTMKGIVYETKKVNRGKTLWKTFYMKQQKWKYQIYLEADGP